MTTTRFAPSPTGYLHVGGARTALFAWLLARHAGGRFLLRIEDTDLDRSTAIAAQQLLDDLRWLGLRWDNPELVYQSRRTELYNRLIDDLLARGLAYKAFETRQELDAMRREAEQAKRDYIYRRRPLADEQLRQYESEGRPHVVRFAMPVREYSFRDVVLDKDIVMPPAEAQDFVIRKADGMPTYHFAVVADDADMGITHVLRGQEHLKNTFYHIALQEALGYPRPVYAHLPVILNMDGSKMGKRDRDRKIRHESSLWLKNTKKTPADLAAAAGLDPAQVEQWLRDSQKQLDLPEQKAIMAVIGLEESALPEILVHDFRANGYLPEALLNFLSLLGWNPGGDREVMTMGDIISLFRLDDVGRSNARFSRDKLLAFNTEHLARADAGRLLEAFRDFLSVNPQSPLHRATDQELARLIAMKPGMRTLRDVEIQSRFFFIPDDQLHYEPEAVDKVLRKNNDQGGDALRDILPILQAIADWSAPALEQAIKQYAERNSLGLGKVAQPLRVAISGSTISPPIFESLEFLGRARTLARMERCIAASQLPRTPPGPA
jgi:glutamyl/glutaminyl-tRNA synthetase